jgi:ABC-type antimicrobial peptide transport system permease subunit
MREGAFALRIKGSIIARELPREIRKMIARSFPQLNVSVIRSQESLIELQTIRERLLAKIASFFALVALGLAAMGIYGVFVLAVNQRRKEIAIRMAVGAEAWSTAGVVLRDGIWAALIGFSMGIGGAWGAGILMQSLLFGSESKDWAVIAPAFAVVLSAALAGLTLPLVKALRTDPALVLRAD